MDYNRTKVVHIINYKHYGGRLIVHKYLDRFYDSNIWFYIGIWFI